MAKQTINIGTIANDGTGSTLRAAGDLINDNFNEIYTSFGDGSTLSAGFVTLTGTETLTNKTLTSPVIANITSTADIDLTATNDVNIPANVGLTFGDDGEKIEGNGTDLTIASSGIMNVNASSDIKLNAAGNDVRLYSSATEFLRLTHSTGDAVIHSIVSDKDIIFKGNDGGSTITALTFDMSDAGSATFNNNVTVTGDLTVNGATTTVSSTNTTVTDNLLELNSGAASNANDTGIIMERGSTGDNAIIAWDESADKFILGTTTATASDIGNLTITAGTIVANLEGNVTGNADTTTALATGRTIGMTGDVVWTSASFDGTGNVTGTASIQANTITSSELSGAVRLDILDSSGTIVKTLFGSGS